MLERMCEEASRGNHETSSIKLLPNLLPTILAQLIQGVRPPGLPKVLHSLFSWRVYAYPTLLGNVPIIWSGLDYLISLPHNDGLQVLSWSLHENAVWCEWGLIYNDSTDGPAMALGESPHEGLQFSDLG